MDKPESLRLCVVQMAMRPAPSAAAFYARLDRFTGIAADYGAAAVLFPEYVTMPLAGVAGHLSPADAIEALTAETDTLRARLSGLASRHGLTVFGGSHLARDAGGKVRNTAHVALPDGTLFVQQKIQSTPDERRVWGVEGGDRLAPVETAFGKAGVLICYDAEFPELARHLVDQGAETLLVPYCTDSRHGHLRVTICARARAVENQVYVATAGNVGVMEGVENMDVQHAQSGIYTPCDHPFARDGIAAECPDGAETVSVADLNPATLRWARAAGAVRNLADRRVDLYATAWTGKR